MVKKIIGGVVAVVAAVMLTPAGTAWASEAPAGNTAEATGTRATTASVVADAPTPLVQGDQVGDLVEGSQQTLVVGGGHIRIDNGFYYTIPVHYVKFDWTYTWKLKNLLSSESGTVGLLCGYLPSKAAVTTCSAIYSVFRTDISNTINAAIAHRKCYKVRLPVTFGGINLAAYDSYYVTC
jgi:hypothetical protein